jgi:hypothetical protein
LNKIAQINIKTGKVKIEDISLTGESYTGNYNSNPNLTSTT